MIVHLDNRQMNPEREALIERSVMELWTQQRLGDALGVTRERARQLLKARGLDKIRVKFSGPHGHGEVKERPIRRCRLEECGQIILAKGRWRFCSAGCRKVWCRRYRAERNKIRYHADPAVREYQAQWQRDNPDKVAAMQRRYRETVAGQLTRQMEAEARAAEPLAMMPCLDCGTLLKRKETIVKISQVKGSRSPLCRDCQEDASLAARGLKRLTVLKVRA